MAVRIAHASIDERNRISGGIAGDQTGKEVCIRSWYSKPWQYMIRCKDAQMREKIAYAMERAANNQAIGYDQGQRNTLLAYAKNVGYDPGKVTTKCETDCSALVSLACIYAGIPESALVVSGNSATTSTLRNRLKSTGKFEIYSASKFLSSSEYILRGDILLKEGSHVVVAIDNGAKSSISSIPSNDIITYTHRNFVKEVQYAIGAKVDGIAGSETLSKTVTVSRLKNNRHVVVRPIQKYLNSIGFNCGTVDGIAGIKFDAAVKAFQRVNGCVVDGEVTSQKNTWKKLLRLS
ncbi:peptidoglycan-binding protein [Acetatifactor muris]|uniref:Peptidoglycan binding domain protein n=1 Tax=Acetatifactor muris TaxID=879566 RepID=A0A2K4ZP17_9FIRM|nr:peptidoglycan-binding domain-containing protein [Acetatifactor muris]MCR2050663.1 peptidoglycan-binding protein [Acetatifactor muris]SOY32210.1 Putative peptidoglycan binding domain protein [Acetatifactor muris]